MDVLKKMEPIVNDYFRFKSIDEIESTEKQFNEVLGSDESDEFQDDVDADDLFS